jgi:hypothetical protein
MANNLHQSGWVRLCCSDQYPEYLSGSGVPHVYQESAVALSYIEAEGRRGYGESYILC